MAVKVQIFGHSFVSRFKTFIRKNSSDFNFNLNLNKQEVMIQYSGYPGASVQSLASRGLGDIEDFEPELVILDIGTNDLAYKSAEEVASSIKSLVDTLINNYHVKFVIVLQILHRFTPAVPGRHNVNVPLFNKNVDSCNQLLVENLNYRSDCQVWWHKGFWGPSQELTIAPDGVHLSEPFGQKKYFYSLRSIVVSHLKHFHPSQ